MGIFKSIKSIFKRKNNVDSMELAQVLLNEFINNTDWDTKPNLTIASEIESHYQAKTRLYRIALVLRSIMGEEQNNSKFSKVRENLESLVLPRTYEEGKQILEELNYATQYLSELLFSQNSKEMSWSITWLKEIGIQESNPVTLALFAMKWMQLYAAVVETLRELNPI